MGIDEQRITIDDVLGAVDTLMNERGYSSRSEAFRNLVREHRSRDEAGTPRGHCVEILSYVYDHATREWTRHLSQMHYNQHNLSSEYACACRL